MKNLTKAQPGLAIINDSWQEWLKVIDSPKLKDAQLVAIGETIFSMFPLIGAVEANIPEDQELNVLLKALRVIFPNITTGDIRYAFKLAFKGKIDFDTKLYNRPLSMSYLGELINKYIDYRLTNDSYVKAFHKLHEKEPKERTEEEIFETMNKHCLQSFEALKTDKSIDYMLWAHYSHLKTKLKLFKVTESKVGSIDVTKYDITNTPSIIEDDYKKKERIIKAIIVWEYYTKLISENKELNLKSFKIYKDGK